MESVLKNLREKSILHQDQVTQIKLYIEKKYPSSSKSEKATIFANAVHQIVDLSVSKFEEKNRIQIRTEVLKSAIAKKIFEINGYDVFEVCALIPQEDELEKITFFEKLTEWINDNQEIQLNQEDVQLMATQVIDQAVNVVLLALEESMLIEPEIKQMATNEHSESVPKSPPERVPSKLSPRDIEKALSMPIEDLPEILFEQLPIQPIADMQMEEPEVGHEEYDSFDIAIELNTKKDRGTAVVKVKEWEELDIASFVQEQKDDVNINKDNKLGGYDTHDLFEESRKKQLLHIKILIITVAVIVSLALITVLIVGALLVSVNQSLRETEQRLHTLEEKNSIEAINNAIQLVSYTVSSSQDEVMKEATLAEKPMLRDSLRYREYNRNKIVAYLEQKDSMLIEKDYLEQLTQISKEFDINPLLLLSIIGQEQGFVPRAHKDAQKIINNPFNVYNSWLSYNTDFYSSCTIAAKTIISSSQNLPDDTDPIVWINRIYAEDQNWHEGVSYFLATLSALNDEVN
jgi:hypothetical protein